MIEAAYNDKAGVTAQFNLNLLAHINRETRRKFRSQAGGNTVLFTTLNAGRIEMYLISDDRSDGSHTTINSFISAPVKKF